MSCADRNYENMEWTNELALQLIDEYEKFPILWDAKDPHHFSRNKKADAWEAISLNVRVDVPQCIQKINSLLGSFRREKRKGRKSIGTGKARKEIYISKWYAFERMQFLLDKDEPRTTLDSEKEEPREEQELDPDQIPSNLDPEQNTPDERDQISNQDKLSIVGTKPFTATGSTTAGRQNKRKAADKDDARLEEAFKILKEAAANKETPPDYCATYSQYVANKLRGYSIKTRVQVENAINNILFQADMGKYDNPLPNSFPQYYQNSAPVSQYPIQFYGDYQNIAAPSPAPSPSYASSTSSTSNCPTPTLNYNNTELQNM